MATFKSDLAEGQSAKGDNRVDGRLLSGKLRNANATITIVGTEVTNDVIDLVDLPEDALIDWSQSFAVAQGAAGTTFTMNIGTATSPNLVTGVNCATNGKKSFGAIGQLDLPEGENKLQALVTAASGLNADAKIRVCLAYIDRS